MLAIYLSPKTLLLFCFHHSYHHVLVPLHMFVLHVKFIFVQLQFFSSDFHSNFMSFWKKFFKIFKVATAFLIFFHFFFLLKWSRYCLTASFSHFSACVFPLSFAFNSLYETFSKTAPFLQVPWEELQMEIPLA